MRCFIECITVASEFGPTKIIRKNENDIGLPIRGFGNVGGRTFHHDIHQIKAAKCEANSGCDGFMIDWYFSHAETIERPAIQLWIKSPGFKRNFERFRSCFQSFYSVPLNRWARLVIGTSIYRTTEDTESTEKTSVLRQNFCLCVLPLCGLKSDHAYFIDNAPSFHSKKRICFAWHHDEEVLAYWTFTIKLSSNRK